LDVARNKLAPTTGYGARVDAQQLGDLRISSVADLHSLQAGVKPSLSFVQQAVEQHDGRFELIGQDSQPGAEGKTAGLGVIDRAGRQLGPAGGGLRREVDVATGHFFTGHPAVPHQPEQGLLGLDMQHVFQLHRVVAGLRGHHQRLDSRYQGAEAAEPHLAERPQPQLVEEGDLVQGVKPATMAIAGAVVQLGQLAEHGRVSRGPQGLLEVLHSGDLLLPQKGDQGLWVVPLGSHYESIPPR
jgi:hypothetical protein